MRLEFTLPEIEGNGMGRDFSALKQGPFDMLVVGGGIYGAWTAYDGALRGLKVALIDKGDWASGTSSASTKLIHGGLRYLEHLRLDMVRACLEERRRLAALAPHMVTPLRFFVPVYEENRLGPVFLKTGLLLYDFLAGKDQPVRGHQSVSRQKASFQYGFIRSTGFVRGFSYGDCQMDDCRFTLDVVKGAAAAGAAAVNYARASRLLFGDAKVIGATAEDQVSGECVDVHAKIVVNAAGPWAPLMDRVHVMSSFVRLSKGVHLVLPPLPTQDALLLMTKEDHRIFFMVPWYGRTLVGTTDADFDGDPDTVKVTPADVDYLLKESNRYLANSKWDESSVIAGFAGLRALKNEPGRSASEVTREWSCVEPRPGILVSVGGKFTSARVDAEKMVDRILELLNRPFPGGSPTATLPLPSTPKGDYRSWRRKARVQNIRAGMDQEAAVWSIFRYGDQVAALRRLIRLNPGLQERMAPGLPFCRAEVVYSAATEMTVHLEDILRRRIPLMVLSRPDRHVVERAAALAGAVLGWSDETMRKETEMVMERWQRW